MHSSIKYILNVVQPSPSLISRTFPSCQTETPYPLNTNVLFPLPSAPSNYHSTMSINLTICSNYLICKRVESETGPKHEGKETPMNMAGLISKEMYEACLGSRQTRSLRPPVRTVNVYIEALMQLPPTQSRWSQQHIALSRLRP